MVVGGEGGGGSDRGVSSSGCFAAPIPKKSFKFKAKRHSELSLMFSLFADSVHIHYMT